MIINYSALHPADTDHMMRHSVRPSIACSEFPKLSEVNDMVS